MGEQKFLVAVKDKDGKITVHSFSTRSGMVTFAKSMVAKGYEVLTGWGE